MVLEAGTLFEVLAILRALPSLISRMRSSEPGGEASPVLVLVDGIFSHVHTLRGIPYPKPLAKMQASSKWAVFSWTELLV